MVSVDVPTWVQRLTTGDFMISTNFIYQSADPAFILTQTYLSTDPAKGSIAGNVDHYANPKVDELLMEAQRLVDPEKRKPLYSEFQKIVSDEIPIIWSHQMSYPTVYRTRVRNLMLTGMGTNENFAEVWLDK